jgi:hypothetical protein
MRNIIVKPGLADDHFSQNPYWILVTFPFWVSDTFDRNRMNSPPEGGFRIVSRKADETEGRETRRLLFDHEVRNWTVAQSKDNHIHTLTMQLINPDGTLSLLNWLDGGDWCMFWAFDNRADYEAVRERLVQHLKCEPWTPRDEDLEVRDVPNGPVTAWNSGLKFVGRLQAPRATEYRDPSGFYEVNYSLQAFGFTELESTIYYDDEIRFKYPDAVQFYQDLGFALDKFLSGDTEHKGFVDTNVAISGLVQILLGKGPSTLSVDRGSATLRKEPRRAALRDSPNVQFEVPPGLAEIIHGSDSRHQELRYYSDMLLQLVGDQTYGEPVREINGYQSVLPDIDRLVAGTIGFTKRPLRDYFPPDPLDFKNKSVWSILKNYVNEPINEMYTAIKPHPKTGLLMPTLVVRRSPYSSDTYQANPNALRALAFSEVPRWYIPDPLILGMNIGKTDGARVNYVQIVPSIMPSENPNVNESLVRLQSPPVVDRASIQRHGLRTYITKVSGWANPVAETNEANASRKYTEFMADILMDGHLRYNGTLTCVGIQDAIQPGDNLVFNGILFHIESLTHSGGIDGGGTKTFTTAFQLSHGIPLRTLKDAEPESKGVTKPVPAAAKTQPASPEKTKKKHVEKKKKKRSEAAAKAETAETKSAIADLEEEIKNYKEPQENAIRRLRNQRLELADIGLVGARGHSERE